MGESTESATPTVSTVGMLPDNDVEGTLILTKLSPRIRAFCEHYAVTGNPYRSGILAGFTDAHAYPYQLLLRPDVLAAVEYYKIHYTEASQTSREKLMRSYAIAANVDVSDICDDNFDIKPKSEWSDATKEALVGLEISYSRSGQKIIKPKFDKPNARDQLARILGMLKDSGPNLAQGLQINIGMVQEGETAEVRAANHLQLGEKKPG